MTAEFFRRFGWALVALAVFFACGAVPPFASYFYPKATTVLARVSAPAIFTVLALACFGGYGRETLMATIGIGSVLIVMRRWTHRARTPIA